MFLPGVESPIADVLLLECLKLVLIKLPVGIPMRYSILLKYYTVTHICKSFVRQTSPHVGATCAGPHHMLEPCTKGVCESYVNHL